MVPRKELDDAATRARDALDVSHQMLAMLREYTALEAQHAARLRALALRMGDCVDRMRPPGGVSDNQKEEREEDAEVEEEEEEELRAHTGQCVAVMDEVVTFLTRFASMHSHLSECLGSDLFDEWSETLAVQEKRADAQEPELGAARAQLKATEEAYRHSHTVFHEDFAHACALYADATDTQLGTDELGSVERAVQDELAKMATAGSAPQRRVRSPSKAMQYVGSISRLLRPSGSGSSHRTGSASKSRRPEPREIAGAIAIAEHQRQECHKAFQAMHRLHVRYSRLTESIHQEYRCVQGECLSSTRTSIRKLVIHVSAFTSNLQYDATQLFQHVEALHANELEQRVHTLSTTELSAAASAFALPPPSNVPLALEHIVSQRFPVVNERPRFLRHQNACHVLSV